MTLIPDPASLPVPTPVTLNDPTPVIPDLSPIFSQVLSDPASAANLSSSIDTFLATNNPASPVAQLLAAVQGAVKTVQEQTTVNTLPVFAVQNDPHGADVVLVSGDARAVANGKQLVVPLTLEQIPVVSAEYQSSPDVTLIRFAPGALVGLLLPSIDLTV